MICTLLLTCVVRVYTDCEVRTRRTSYIRVVAAIIAVGHRAQLRSLLLLLLCLRASHVQSIAVHFCRCCGGLARRLAVDVLQHAVVCISVCSGKDVHSLYAGTLATCPVWLFACRAHAEPCTAAYMCPLILCVYFSLYVCMYVLLTHVGSPSLSG